MSAEHEERILDASLEEVLGGHYPPDLTAKIIESWEARVDALAANETGVSPSIVAQPASGVSAPPVQWWAEPVPPPLDEDPAVHVAARPSTGGRSSTRWLAVAVAASLLLAVTAGYYLREDNESARGGIADSGRESSGAVFSSREEGTIPPRIRRQEFVARKNGGGRHEPPAIIVDDTIDEP